MFAVGGVVLVVGHCHRRWGGVGRCPRSWGGAGPLSVFVGWCWAWVLVADAGGGDGPSSWWVVVSPHSRSCRHLAIAWHRRRRHCRCPSVVVLLCCVTNVVGGGRYGWWRRRGEGGDEVGVRGCCG